MSPSGKHEPQLLQTRALRERVLHEELDEVCVVLQHDVVPLDFVVGGESELLEVGREGERVGEPFSGEGCVAGGNRNAESLQFGVGALAT